MAGATLSLQDDRQEHIVELKIRRPFPVTASLIIIKPKLLKSEQDPAQEFKTFERLPAKTKERSLLQEQTVKSTGPENGAVQKQIREKSR